ncbi:replication initiation protein [Paraburkholderia sp. D15]|uniref:replication initiation protein n=1 Tax=Paraburkholderia sp. D15 TaxID=2880218 RepID=UPI002478DE13|nr:replication initiation protein [Paraburkholderia sp. D15]WGS51133.1 replication initiation protein [Paraburkholderia sp. D15]
MNTNTRLTTVAPDLVELGKGLPASKRKALARLIAEWACRETGTMTLLGEDRVKLLLDDAHTVTQQDRDRLAGDVDDLDEKYFAIVEQHDGLDDEGDALKWFRKARAAASLLYSLDSDSVPEFCETLYEAQAATDDLDNLKALCRR